MRNARAVLVASIAAGFLLVPSWTVAANTSAPVVAPGESWIVYQAWDGAPHLRLVRPDGSGDHLLVDGMHPDWSPDGGRIAYVVGDTAIWTVNVDGSEAQALPIPCDDGCVLNDSPAWSPDGSTIAFTRLVDPPDGDAYTDVAALDLASGDIRTLYTPPAGVGTWYVRWAPDGRSIVVNGDRYPSIDSSVVSGGALEVVDLSGSQPVARQLTDPGMFATYPDWSPDGSRIVFTTHDLGVRDGGNQQDPLLASDLYTINPDGTDLVQLTDNPTGTTLIRNGTASGPLSSQPSWTPDGRIIFVQVEGEAWPGWQMATIGADGTGPRIGRRERLAARDASAHATDGVGRAPPPAGRHAAPTVGPASPTSADGAERRGTAGSSRRPTRRGPWARHGRRPSRDDYTAATRTSDTETVDGPGLQDIIEGCYFAFQRRIRNIRQARRASATPAAASPAWT